VTTDYTDNPRNLWLLYGDYFTHWRGRMNFEKT
jgi:hypothetical protein